MRRSCQCSVPPAFAHGCMVLSEAADFLYKTTDDWAPQHERCLLWNDPAVGVEWPHGGCAPILSERDRVGVLLAQAECYE